jgi:hypothetical protein
LLPTLLLHLKHLIFHLFSYIVFNSSDPWQGHCLIACLKSSKVFQIQTQTTKLDTMWLDYDQLGRKKPAEISTLTLPNQSKLGKLQVGFFKSVNKPKWTEFQHVTRRAETHDYLAPWRNTARRRKSLVRNQLHF